MIDMTETTLNQNGIEIPIYAEVMDIAKDIWAIVEKDPRAKFIVINDYGHRYGAWGIDKLMQSVITDIIDDNNEKAIDDSEVTWPGDGYEDAVHNDWAKLIIDRIDEAEGSNDGCSEFPTCPPTKFAMIRDRYDIPCDDCDAYELMRQMLFGEDDAEFRLNQYLEGMDPSDDPIAAARQDFIDEVVEAWEPSDRSSPENCDWISRRALEMRLGEVFDQELELCEGE